MSASTKAKIRKKLHGRHHKPHKVSAATRAKLSRALRGKKRHRPGHPIHRRKGLHHKGHVVSAATRAKLRAARKGHIVSAATRAKLSAAIRKRGHVVHKAKAGSTRASGHVAHRRVRLKRVFRKGHLVALRITR